MMDVDYLYTVFPVAQLPSHQDRAWHVAWNPTKPLIASCSADKSVRLYSYAQRSDSSPSAPPTLPFTLLTTIHTEHAKTVRAVAWSPSGTTLATASFDSNIAIWEEEDGEWECMSTLEGHETECKSVAYSSDGTLLASCSRDKTVWIWEVHPDSDFECMSVLMEHTQDVKCVSWHPTEEVLASASYDDTIKLYMDDPSDDWFCFTTLTGHTSTVWALSWDPTGRFLASASDDKTVRVWQRVAQHKFVCVLALTGHDRAVYSASWGVGKSGKAGSLGWIASAGGDGVIRVWELSEAKVEGPSAGAKPLEHNLIARLPMAHGEHDINTVTWCPRKGHEDLLATAGDDGSARIWRVVPA
ncbi:WD40-repeat-containing domain protein [Cyathus striatus]|nr:WD40-repeat-containing domain protein [Cyathus striatus]